MYRLKKCDSICPMNIEISKKKNVGSIQCINCFECVGTCPIENTIEYKKRSITSIYKKMIIGGALILILVGSVMTFAVLTEESNMLDGISVMVRNNHEGIEKIDQSTDTPILNNGITESTENTKEILSGYKDGIYTGHGTGFKGTMTV